MPRAPNLVQEHRGAGILFAHEPGRDHDLADREPVQQVGKRIVMILIGVAQEDLVKPGDAPAPERRGDDPPSHVRISHPAAIVENRVTVLELEQDRQSMADGKQIAFDRGRRARPRRTASPGSMDASRGTPEHDQPVPARLRTAESSRRRPTSATAASPSRP